MTSLLNVLKTMETETTGVKNDVINYLLEDVENYSPQAKLQDLSQHGCQSGMVNHLIYYTDTVAYFEEHEEEITEMLELLGIEDVESWDGLEELSDLFPRLETPDERHENAENEPMELNRQDKNYLAWAIFEYEASVLLDELSEMGML